MNCPVCERLRKKRDLMELGFMLAMNTVRDNPAGDARQRELLRAMAREALIDLEMAKAEAAWHQDKHAAPEPGDPYFLIA
jgi:hypothetical protein